MTSLLGDYLVNLAAELSAHVLAAIPGWVRGQLAGDETDEAVRRCLEFGIVAFVSHASSDDSAYAELHELIFPHFFRNEQVGVQVARLLEGQNLNRVALQYMAGQAGYTPEKFPALDFTAAMAEFEAAFLKRAVREPVLQGVINASSMLEQIKLGQASLSRLDRIAGLLEQILQAGGTIVKVDSGQVVTLVQGTYVHYAITASPETDLSAAGNAYLTWLMKERQTLSLRAMSTGKTGGKERPPELAQVYVALNTRSYVADNAGSQERTEKQKPLSALAALAVNRRMVLLGDPGSGKSTFVSHLAYCLAAHALYPADNWLSHLPDWPETQTDRLPLLIILRDFVNWLPDPLPNKARAHHLWDFISETLRQEKLEEALPVLQQALVDGRVVLLLDGLDEVTTVAQRRFVRDAVQTFSGRYSGCSLLVTCRVFSYKKPDPEKEEEDLRLPASVYPVFELASFDEQQRDIFIHAWYAELKRQGHLPGQDAGRLSRDLQQAIRRSDLRRVAGNPLLLTVMAVVHAEEGRLPDSRALLYNKTIDLLLSRWEETKAEDEIPLLRQLLHEANRTDVDLKARLAEVAFQVHTQAGTTSDGEQVSDVGEAYLCQELSRLHRRDLGWGQRLLEVIKTRAGLLIERSPGQFAFPHRTFQEYLAGVYLASQPDFAKQALAWARRDVGWWPLVLFAIEHLVYVNERPLDPLPLISKLCPETVDDTVAGWQQTWLAGETLLSLGRERAEDSEWGQQLSRRVRQRLTALLEGGKLSPRERAEAGKALAQLGDKRPGVGVIERDGVKLPDICWSDELPPAGTDLPQAYTIGDEKSSYDDEKPRQVEIKQRFRLARYPITNAQFQCFLEAEDRDNPDWWKGIPDEERQFREPRWPYANHPRETVSWYQAMAFCRWLTQKLHDGLLPAEPLTGDPKQYTITLPHENEWEVAARWPNESAQERIYPWGPEFDATKANTGEGDSVGGTTAVGLYPSGKNEALDLYDLSGNVWEWCRNRYGQPEGDMDPTQVDMGTTSRVLRGGSWGHYAGSARAAFRNDLIAPNGNEGFRVVLVVVRPPSHHPDH